MPDIAASLTDVVLTKRCSICHKKLPVTAFYKRTRSADGLKGHCKRCDNEYSVKYKRENPIFIQTSQMVVRAKRRAVEKKLNFDIDTEYVRSLVVSHCPVLGMPLEWSCRRNMGNITLDGSPSLDRIDPIKGYVKGNIWIISYRANLIKNNATHEELKLVTKAVGEALVRSLEF
jgi:hypothetical protein